MAVVFVQSYPYVPLPWLLVTAENLQRQWGKCHSDQQVIVYCSILDFRIYEVMVSLTGLELNSLSLATLGFPIVVYNFVQQ